MSFVDEQGGIYTSTLQDSEHTVTLTLNQIAEYAMYMHCVWLEQQRQAHYLQMVHYPHGVLPDF